MNFQIILDALPFSVYWIDSRKKIFKGGNPYFLSLLKLTSLSELIAKPMSSILVGDYLRIVDDLFDKSIKNKGKKFSAVYHKILNDHEEPTLIQSISLLPKKELVIFSEIYPPIKDFNQYLWDEKEKLAIYLNNIVENVPASIYWKDANSVILGGSKLHTELTGYSDNKAVVGKTDYDFAWRGQAERIIENDRFVMKNKQMISFEERAKLPDDGIHIFLTQKSPLKGKLGEIIGVLGVSIDITELKNTQKKLKKAKLAAESANRTKTEFLANMSHDIRTPLTGIIGLSQLLAHRLVMTEDKEDLSLMYQASERLLNLLNDVLDVASLESVNEAKIKLESFSLLDVSQALKGLLLPAAKLKGLDFQVNVDISTPENVLSDRIKLERILLNLVNNAIKFTKKGEVSLSIKELALLPQRMDGMHVEFTISDTGIGIQADKLAYIFDHFFRVASSFEEEDQGYGVGLYIVKKFINLLGGEIEVKSEVGVGTKFSFRLFMTLAQSHKTKKFKNKNSEPFIFLKAKDEQARVMAEEVVNQSELPSIESPEDKRPAKKNILLIEDDQLVIKFSKELLFQAGYTVTIVSTSKEALNLAKNHSFDLIITDLGLPGISGYELAVLYRYWERVNHKPIVPIIVLTAHGQGKFKEECLAAGINEIWLKPLTVEKIKKLDKYWLDNKKVTVEQLHIPVQFKSTENELDVEESNIEIEKANLLEIINSYPIFDKSISLNNLSDNEKLFQEIVEMFNQSIPEQLQELEKAYALKNWAALENIVHKIKGGACYVGAIRLNYVCQNFLRCYLTGQSQLLDSLYQCLIGSLTETQQALLLL
jgi:PAS domain S-box-containing protein